MARKESFEKRSIHNQVLVLNALDKIEKLQETTSENVSNLYFEVGLSLVSGNVEIVSELKAQTRLLLSISDRIGGLKGRGVSSGVLAPSKDLIMQMAGVLIALGGAFLIFGDGLVNIKNINKEAALTFALVMLAVFGSIALLFREGMVISIKQAIKLHFVAILLAFTIEIVAQIFSKITKVGPLQFVTAIAIAATMVPIVTHLSQAVRMIFKGGLLNVLGNITGGIFTGIAMLGALIFLPMMALSIALSAGVLANIRPVSTAALTTVLLIGLALVPMTFVMVELITALRGPVGMSRIFHAIGTAMGGGVGMGTKEAAIGSLALIPMLAIALVMSSMIFNFLPPPTYSAGSLLMVTLLGLALIPISASFAIILTVMRFAMGFKSLFFAAAALPILAVGIVGVALVFKALPKLFKKPPPLWWALLTGVVLMSFAIPFSIIARILLRMRGVSLAKMALIAISILPLMALSIVGVAWVFTLLPAEGVLRAPGVFWTLRAGLVMMIFGFPFVVMTLMFKALTIGDAIEGGVVMLILAGIIVGIAHIFRLLPDPGDLRVPGFKWTLRTGFAMMIFGIPFVVMTLLFQALTIAGMIKGALAMAVVALAIVGIAWVFQLLPDEFKSPPLKWTVETGIVLLIFSVALIAFSLTIGLLGPAGFIALGIGALAMVVVALAIVGIAWVFQLLPDEFKIIPLAWSYGLAALAIPMLTLTVAAVLSGAMIMAAGGPIIGLGVLTLGLVGLLLIGLALVAFSYIIDWVNPAVFKPGGILYAIADTMSYFAKRMVDVFIYLVANLLPIVKEFIHFLLSGEILPGFNQILDMFAGFATKMIDAIVPLIEVFLPMFEIFFGTIVDILQVMGGIVIELISAIADVFKTAIETFPESLGAVSKFMQDMDVIGPGQLLALGGALIVVAGGLTAITLAMFGGSVIGAVGDLVSNVAGAIGTGVAKLAGMEPKRTGDPMELVSGIYEKIKQLVEYEDPMRRLAKSFYMIGIGMGKFKKEFNALDTNRLVMVNELLINSTDLAGASAEATAAIATGIREGIAKATEFVGGLFGGEEEEKVKKEERELTSSETQKLMNNNLIEMNGLLNSLNQQMTTMNTKLDGELQVRVAETDYGIGT